MGKIQIEHDPNFLRAKALLAGTINTPEYLIKLWMLLPNTIKSPSIEKLTPWYFGLEDLIN